jgi:hypothetical protein
MIPIYFSMDLFNISGVVVVGVVVFVAWAGLLKSRRKRQELNATKNIGQYLERFAEMNSDALEKYGPSVEFLRPEMEIGDDPEAFDRAWKEFERGRRVHLTASL